MLEKSNRKIIVGIGIITSFALLVLSISFYFNYQHNLRQESRLSLEAIDDMSAQEIKEFLEQRRNTEPVFHLEIKTSAYL